MNHGFINWISGLIGENTSGQTGNYFADFKFMSIMNDIVIDQEIITEQFSLLTHVLEQTSDTSRQVQNMSRFILLEDCLGSFK